MSSICCSNESLMAVCGRLTADSSAKGGVFWGSALARAYRASQGFGSCHRQIRAVSSAALNKKAPAKLI